MTNSQRIFLRKIAQTIPTKFQFGKDKLHQDWIKMVDAALTKNELIKLHILKVALPEKQELIQTLVNELKAEWVQTIGHRVVLYRHNPQAPRINLPK